MTPNKNTEMEKKIENILVKFEDERISQSIKATDEDSMAVFDKYSLMITTIFKSDAKKRNEQLVEKLEKERDMHILNHPPMSNTAMFKSTREALTKLDPVVNTYNIAISLLQEETKC